MENRCRHGTDLVIFKCKRCADDRVIGKMLLEMLEQSAVTQHINRTGEW